MYKNAYVILVLYRLVITYLFIFHSTRDELLPFRFIDAFISSSLVSSLCSKQFCMTALTIVWQSYDKKNCFTEYCLNIVLHKKSISFVNKYDVNFCTFLYQVSCFHKNLDFGQISFYSETEIFSIEVYVLIQRMIRTKKVT